MSLFGALGEFLRTLFVPADAPKQPPQKPTAQTHGGFRDGFEKAAGEARKLALAVGLGRHVWALVLDEPTNHLDLPTIERLEKALATYPGAVVLVTHDDAFARAVTTRTLCVENGQVRGCDNDAVGDLRSGKRSGRA